MLQYQILENMLGQRGGFLWVRSTDGQNQHSTTTQVRNENVFVEIALTSVMVFDDVASGATWIAQIISDNGIENFDESVGAVELFRRNVTSVTFKVAVYKCQAKARWMLNSWP